MCGKSLSSEVATWPDCGGWIYSLFHFSNGFETTLTSHVATFSLFANIVVSSCFVLRRGFNLRSVLRLGMSVQQSKGLSNSLGVCGGWRHAAACCIAARSRFLFTFDAFRNWFVNLQGRIRHGTYEKGVNKAWIFSFFGPEVAKEFNQEHSVTVSSDLVRQISSSCELGHLEAVQLIAPPPRS